MRIIKVRASWVSKFAAVVLGSSRATPRAPASPLTETSGSDCSSHRTCGRSSGAAARTCPAPVAPHRRRPGTCAEARRSTRGPRRAYGDGGGSPPLSLALGVGKASGPRSAARRAPVPALGAREDQPADARRVPRGHGEPHLVDAARPVWIAAAVGEADGVRETTAPSRQRRLHAHVEAQDHKDGILGGVKHQLLRDGEHRRGLVQREARARSQSRDRQARQASVASRRAALAGASRSRTILSAARSHRQESTTCKRRDDIVQWGSRGWRVCQSCRLARRSRRGRAGRAA